MYRSRMPSNSLWKTISILRLHATTCPSPTQTFCAPRQVDSFAASIPASFKELRGEASADSEPEHPERARAVPPAVPVVQALGHQASYNPPSARELRLRPTIHSLVSMEELNTRQPR